MEIRGVPRRAGNGRGSRRGAIGTDARGPGIRANRGEAVPAGTWVSRTGVVIGSRLAPASPGACRPSRPPCLSGRSETLPRDPCRRRRNVAHGARKCQGTAQFGAIRGGLRNGALEGVGTFRDAGGTKGVPAPPRRGLGRRWRVWAEPRSAAHRASCQACRERQRPRQHGPTDRDTRRRDCRRRGLPPTFLSAAMFDAWKARSSGVLHALLEHGSTVRSAQGRNPGRPESDRDDVDRLSDEVGPGTRRPASAGEAPGDAATLRPALRSRRRRRRASRETSARRGPPTQRSPGRYPPTISSAKIV